MILASFLILLAYLCYTVWVAKSIPDSISATYYIVPKGWVFQVALFLTAVTLFVSWVGKGYDFLAFLSCGGLIFVSVAPQFKLRLEGVIHYTSAIICGASAIAWIILMGQLFIALIPFAVGGILNVLNPKKWMWWIEISLAVSLYWSLVNF